MRPLKIFVHDYAGHPFAAGLSRTLAKRGCTVAHGYFAGDPGPKGRLTLAADDPAGLQFQPIAIAGAYEKGDFLKRRAQDAAYGRAAAAAIAAFKPDIVLSGTTPTDSQGAIQRAAQGCGAKFVFWCQDIYSVAVERLLARRLPVANRVIGAHYAARESAQMRAADAVVLISEDFRPQVQAWGVARERTLVIPNWGALEEIPERPKDNAFARAHGLVDKTVFLYSGTLGLKHNPDLIAALAQSLRARPEARVVAAAAGLGVARLKARKAELGLDNLLLMDLQPIERLADMLGTADVCTAMIERDAGAFSVPSKVLSYLCAGRPVLAAAPRENLAAAIVREAGCGAITAPEDFAEFQAAAARFAGAADLRARLGARARRYAEAHFQLDRVADRFEQAFAIALRSAAPARRPAPRTTKVYGAEVVGARGAH